MWTEENMEWGGFMLKNAQRALIFLSISFSVCVVVWLYAQSDFSILPKWFPSDPSPARFNKGRFASFFILFNCLFWALWGIRLLFSRNYANFQQWKVVAFIENHAKKILLCFIILILYWFGMVIFLNPYNWMFNYGDATTWTQILHNLSNGFRPEMSYHSEYATLSGVNLQVEQYTFSTFSFGQWWLPLLLLTPLYLIYPFPPMHVYAIIVVVIVGGAFGIYLAVRSIGGTKAAALLAAIGYCFLPQMEHAIFNKGYFDNVGYAVLPYVFAALFRKRWNLFYLSIVLLSMISIPYAYLSIGLSIAVILFLREFGHGGIAFLIGTTVLLVDFAIFKQTRCGIWPEGVQVQGIFSTYVLNRQMITLIEPLLYWSGYLFVMFMTVSFLPFLYVRRDGKWNCKMVAMLFFIAFGSLMLLFRSYGWNMHRTAFVVVPIYLSSFMSLTHAKNDQSARKSEVGYWKMRYGLLSTLLVSSIVAMSVASTFRYPWAGIIRTGNGSGITIKDLITETESKANKEAKRILSTIDEYVPREASIAYNIAQGLEAFLHNRRYAWHLGREPEGVEYYILYKWDRSRRPWKDYLIRLCNNNSFKLLYSDNKLVIYGNINPQPIPRKQSVLGWDVLRFWKGCKDDAPECESRCF